MLTEFCKIRDQANYMNGDHILSSSQNQENTESSHINIEDESEKEAWADENLDEEIKAILASYDNGREMPIDFVSHLEYFYNTLDCSFSTKNPFDHPQNYPALLFREPFQSTESSNSHDTHQDKNLFEKHRALIFPNSNKNKSTSKSGSRSATKSLGSSEISP